VSDQTIALKLENREVFGKAVKQLRADGKIPAVIHDHGKESVHVMAPFIDVFKVYQQAGKHHTVDLTVGNKKYLALIKDASFEPRKNQLVHVVFNAIRQDQKVETEVPIELTGEIPAEKSSLTVLTHLEVVEVEGLPKDLVDSISVDATKLAEVGDKLTVADLVIPSGLTLITEPETVIATVEMPRDQIADANAAAAEMAAENAGETTEEAAAPESPDTEAKTDSE
jgi:large subunit ribosomal protein L25